MRPLYCTFKTSPRVKAKLCCPAFTLVELLTVVAIIGVLSAILIPAVNSVRKTAHVAGCASNLRQLYLAHRGYALDHNDRIPQSKRYLDYNANPGYESDYKMHWFQLLIMYGYLGRADIPNPYVGLEATAAYSLRLYYTVLSCPLVAEYRLGEQTQTDSDSGQRIPAGANGYLTYGSNLELTDLNTTENRDGIFFGQLANPSQTVLLGDQKLSATNAHTGIWINSGQYLPEGVHDGRANLVFCDGHVELMEVDDIPTSASDPQKYQLFWRGRYSSN